jgi:hypothetical protein
MLLLEKMLSRSLVKKPQKLEAMLKIGKSLGYQQKHACQGRRNIEV